MKKFLYVSLTVMLSVLPLLSVYAEPTPPAFPKKDITWIVPYAAGGFDAYSRAIAKAMPKYLPKYLSKRVNIVVKNLPGAGGRTACTTLYRSKPDGYTIGILNVPGFIVSQFIMKAEYDMTKMEYLGRASAINYALWVGKDSPLKSLRDFQKAKTPLRFASYGFGGSGSLVGIATLAKMGIPYTLVTGYTSAPEVALSLMKGEVDAVIESDIVVLMPYYKEREIKPVAIISEGGSELLPDAPNVAKLGYPELAELGAHRIIGAPPGTPGARLKILEGAILKAMKDKETQEWAVETNMPLAITDGARAKEIVLKQVELFAKYTDILKEAQEKFRR
jgi:tripartite-type tricarboxylate transporter receptor subunit TctC